MIYKGRGNMFPNRVCMYTVCQRNCDSGVIPVRFVVVACAATGLLVRRLMKSGFVFRRLYKALEICLEESSGHISPTMSMACANPTPSLARSNRTSTSRMTSCNSAEISGLWPTWAILMRFSFFRVMWPVKVLAGMPCFSATSA